MYNCTDEIEAIREDDPHKLMNIWESKGISFTKSNFKTVDDFTHYVKSINLCDLLGLEKYNNCIFHDDHTRSASIHRVTETGDYLYTCHSSNCFLNDGKNFSGNIFTIIRKITKNDIGHVIKFLIAALNASVEDDVDDYLSDPNHKEYIGMLDNNKQFIKDHGNLICPTAMKIVRKSIRVLYTIYDVAESKNFNLINQNYNGIIFSESTAHIRSEMAKRYKVSDGLKISQELAVLAYLGFLTKLPYDMIHTNRLIKAQMISRAADSGEKLINQFFLPQITEEKLQEIESRAMRWEKFEYKKRTFSFEEIHKKENIFEAMRVYPQGPRVKQTDRPKRLQTKDDFIQH